MGRITAAEYLPVVAECAPAAKGLAYLDGVTCIFYVTPLCQLRCKAFETRKVLKLLDGVTWVSVVEDVNAQGEDVARVYYSTLDGGVWHFTYRKFGTNDFVPERLTVKGGRAGVRQLSATKHTFVFSAATAKPPRTAYILVTDDGGAQFAHVANDPLFTQAYTRRMIYSNHLAPTHVVNTPVVGFHQDDALRMHVAIQRTDVATRVREVGVYVVDFEALGLI